MNKIIKLHNTSQIQPSLNLIKNIGRKPTKITDALPINGHYSKRLFSLMQVLFECNNEKSCPRD